MTTLLPPSAAARPVPALPAPRGPLSEALLETLTGVRPAAALPSADPGTDPCGDDLQLALHLAYALHSWTLPALPEELEWDPDLLRARASWERPFLASLRRDTSGGTDVEAALAPLLREPVTGTGPSWHLSSSGTLEQLREYVAHRSVYHLLEADPQALLVPRLEGQAKAAVVTVQHDEYGAGRVERMHAQLFADAMTEVGLEPVAGAYLDVVPAATLAPVNLMWTCGLRRALRGAAFGQFLMIEVTSSPGSRRMSAAFARLSAGSAGRRFYDEHVEADAVHEQLLRAALRDLLSREPELAADVVLGIEAGLLLEQRWGDGLLGAWQAGRSSLRRPLGQVQG